MVRMRSMSTRSARIRGMTAAGMRPLRAYASHAAISTRSHAWYFAASLQIRPMAGRVYRSITPSPYRKTSRIGRGRGHRPLPTAVMPAWSTAPHAAHYALVLWAVGAGQLGPPTPDVHLYLDDRYWRLAQYHADRVISRAQHE